MGSSSCRLLNQSTHSSVANSTASKLSDDPVGVNINEEGHIDEARPGADIGEAGHSEQVRRGCTKHSVHVIEPGMARPCPDPCRASTAPRCIVPQRRVRAPSAARSSFRSSLRRFSFVCRSSRTSRSSALILAALPIHWCSDCAAQLILEDAETMAAHCDGYSLSWSSTIRIAWAPASGVGTSGKIGAVQIIQTNQATSGWCHHLA
jgi:hypothetical protein